jgi:hypothetical protein
LFEKEVKKLKLSTTSPRIDGDNNDYDNEDEDKMTVTPYVTKSLVNHKNYKKAVESKNTLCGKRASLELIVASAQKKQAEIVKNKCMHSKDYKQVLEVGDIGAIHVPPTLQGSTDFPYIPVMVTKTNFSKTTGGVKYGL